MGKRRESAVAFFWEHAGYSYRPGVESPEQGRYLGAEALAEAECWLCDRYSSVEWVPEQEPVDRSGIGHDGPLWVCTVRVRDDQESLGGIDLGPDGDDTQYKRVVAGELALELMKRYEPEVVATGETCQ